MNGDRHDPEATPTWNSTASTTAESTALDSGRGIGWYHLERVLGEGTYGRVYLAQHEVLGRRVAIKVLHRHHGSGRQEIRAFLNEALILAEANHPGIVPVYDAGWTEDGLYYIVSRYVEGGDLRGLLARRRPAPRDSAGIVLAVAEALDYAHAHGLVHRDIKPANILMDLAGKPLVADFGVALRDKDFGRGTPLAGTPAYMSPEQARGQGHRVDGRSDIFSLGVVLYEMLTGRRPFRGTDPRELAEQIIRSPALPPRQVDETIPEDLEPICLKAMAKRASDRYSTALELAKDLRQFHETAMAEGGHTGAGPAIPSPPTPTAWTGTRELVLTSTMSGQPGSPRCPNRIQPRGFRPFGPRDAGFFLDLLPGTRDPEGLPEIVSFWRSRIEGSDGQDPFRVGLIFGSSGSGKTSIVAAGVVPRLSERIVSVSVTATAAGTEALLLSRFRRRYPRLLSGFNLAASFIAARKGLVLPLGSRLLVIIDQFERWLQSEQSRDEKGLLAALRQCDGEHIQALLVVRDDSWLAASRLLRELGDRIIEGENATAVDPFDPRHAREVLAAFGRALGALPDEPTPLNDAHEAFLDDAITALERGGQVLPMRLVLLAEMFKGRAWDPEQSQAVQGLTNLEAAFLEAAFDAESAPAEHRLHRAAARSMLRVLLSGTEGKPEAGRRSYRELLAASGYAARPLDGQAVLRILDEELHLITPVDSDELDEIVESTLEPGDRSYRFTHDYFVEPLTHWLARDRRQPSAGPHPAHPHRPTPGGLGPSSGPPIDINTATEEELSRLPGVGSVIARRIIEARPCRSPDELLRITGITEKKLAAMKPMIRTS